MVTAFVVVFAVALLFVTGLVLDGGRILAAKREAGNLSESAARAGAQQISEEAVRAGGAVVLDAEAAESAACAFLARAEHPCGGGTGASAAGNTVTVTIADSVGLVMLPLADQTFTVDGDACVAVGITGTEPTANC
jgi:hypothetical protein